MQAGTIAEYAVIKEDELAIKPANISHQEAASIPLVGLTAWQAMVTKGDLQKGQKVLIHAGSASELQTYASHRNIEESEFLLFLPYLVSVLQFFPTPLINRDQKWRVR